jgi:hypothetical protein
MWHLRSIYRVYQPLNNLVITGWLLTIQLKRMPLAQRGLARACMDQILLLMKWESLYYLLSYQDYHH